MPASRFLKIVKKPAKFQSAVSMCQFPSPGTLLYAAHCVFEDTFVRNIRMHMCTYPLFIHMFDLTHS